MNTEIVRRLDELNRVVLPTDARKAANIVGTDVVDRKSTRLNSSHTRPSRMPSSA